MLELCQQFDSQNYSSSSSDSSPEEIEEEIKHQNHVDAIHDHKYFESDFEHDDLLSGIENHRK